MRQSLCSFLVSQSQEAGVVEFGALLQLPVQSLEAIHLAQGLLVGEQVGAQTQTVALDLNSHGRQGGGEHVKGAELPVLLLDRLHGGVDDAVVDRTQVVLVHILHEVGVHGQMVAAQDDGALPDAMKGIVGEQKTKFNYGVDGVDSVRAAGEAAVKILYDAGAQEVIDYLQAEIDEYMSK